MGMKLCRGISPEWVQPEECPAKFLLRPLDSVDYAELRMGINGKTGEVSSSAMRRALQKALINWEGVEDPEGKPMDFDSSKIGDIPADVILHLVNKLFEMSQLRDQEKKA